MTDKVTESFKPRHKKWSHGQNENARYTTVCWGLRLEIEILMEGKGMPHAITQTKATSETISTEPEGHVETWEIEGFTTAGQRAEGKNGIVSGKEPDTFQNERTQHRRYDF